MISFIIPTFNEAQYICATLKQFKALEGISYEVIVSDNKSEDSTVKIAKEFADQVVENKDSNRATIGEIRNRGAQIAKYEYLIFLDSAVMIPNISFFVKTALSRFENNGSLAGLCVKVRVAVHTATFADNFFFGVLDTWIRLSNNVFKKGSANGKFMMIRADAFKKAGGFDASLAAAEDFDMFKRLSKGGHTYFDATLKVYHPGRRAHAYGWPKLLALWIINGISVALFRRSVSKEWKSIR